jgi:hypothetical protein
VLKRVREEIGDLYPPIPVMRDESIKRLRAQEVFDETRANKETIEKSLSYSCRAGACHPASG